MALSLRGVIAVVMLVAFGANGVRAEYPERPITLVVGSGAGGINDLIARICAEHMSKTLGQPLVVENQPGGGSTIAISEVMKAAPDGYTLLVNGSVHSVVAELYPQSRINVLKDVQSVSMMAGAPQVLTVHNSIPITDFPSFVAYAKANPNKLTFGSNGRGSGAHLAAELLKSMAKVELKHIPYRTTPAALNDLLTGRISVMFGTMTMFSPHIQAGSVRGIAASTIGRAATLPDIPTVDELGLKGFEASSWTGLYAPNGTRPAIIAKINEALERALNDSSVQQRFAQLGIITPPAVGPDFLSAYIAKDVVRWSAVLRANAE